MAESNNRFAGGRMNKDFDERLVPNNEYRDALNVQTSTSDGSDVGTLQNILSNAGISSISGDGKGTAGYCVGSITDEKTDTIYWLIAGHGIDIIAEYNYITKEVLPVLIDVYPVTTVAEAGSGRVLNFDKNFLITGINIIEDYLFWTDNNTEPKQINITRSKYGSSDFTTHSDFYVKNPNSTWQIPPFVAVGPVKESQITVIKKSPKIAPRLEMKNTNRGDLDEDGVIGNVVTTMVISDPVGTLIEDDGDGWVTMPITLTTESVADYKIGDFIVLTPASSGINVTQSLTSIIVEIMSPVRYIPAGGGAATLTQAAGDIGLSFKAQIVSGDTSINGSVNDFSVTLKQPTPLFEFVFPRFAYRYKYMDGQYSTFSPFSEVAFLPSKFDYLPKEGYNLGMVNTLRKLAVKDFVDKNLIPEDVDSIDILYKESNSPTIYTVDTVNRVLPVSGTFDAWNGVGVETVSSTLETTGYFEVKSEKIHAIVPSNQLLRGWDNVPRKALGQEVIGNRLVLANYLQNYNMENVRRQNRSAFDYGGSGSGSIRDLYYQAPKNNNITVDLKLQHVTQAIKTDGLVPEVLDPSSAFKYSPAKSIKTLRTYQLGVVYIDEFGRETPVFSASKNARNSIKVEKSAANLQGQLKAQIFSAMPDWAKNFKFFVKESSNEYYNLAMDRWYPAQDGNIWLSFPSAERNKIDDETFLILKKGHNNDLFVSDDTKYKVLAIDNEAPLFIKTRRVPKGSLISTSILIPPPLGGSFTVGVGPTASYSANFGFPVPGGTYISIEKAAGQFIVDKILDQGLVDWQFRINGALNGVSAWYSIQSIVEDTVNGYWEFTSKKIFGQDMNCSSSVPWSSGVGPTGVGGNLTIEFVKKEIRNLPEFDGRFFVKVLSDSTIKENIIGEEVITSNNWTIKNSIVSQYINPEPAYGQSWISGNGNGLLAGDEYFGVNIDRLSIDGREPNGYSYHGVHDGSSGGNSYWDKAGSTTNVNSTSSGWFIDKIEAFRPFKITGGAGGWNYGGKDDDSHFTNPDAGGLWEAYWSTSLPPINAPSAYEDPNPRNQLQLMGTNTHTNPLGVNSYMNIAGLKEHGNKLRTSTLTYGEIMPSVGIDATENIIHLSFVGLGPDTTTGNITTLDRLKTSFDDAAWAAQFVQEQAFVSDIMTPGTLWRWKEDPDKIVYKSKPYDAGTMLSVSPAEWAKNTFDAKDSAAGVSLYNYANFQDYGKKHVNRWEGHIPFNGNDNYIGALPVSHWVSQGIGNPPAYQWTFLMGGYVAGAIAFGLAAIGNVAYTAYHVLQGLTSNPNTSGGWGPTTSHFEYPCMTKDYGQPRNRRRRFMIAADAYVDNDGKVIDQSTGPWGLGSTPLTAGGLPNMAYLPTNDPDLAAHFNVDGTVLNSTDPNANVAYTDRPTTRPPGIRPDGMYTGSHSTIPGLKTNAFVANTPGVDSFAPGSVTWEIVEPYSESDDENTFTTTNPAIWETEPKENIDLDLYHEVGQLYPTKLDGTNMEQFVGPIRDDITLCTKVECWHPDNGWVLLNSGSGLPGADDIRIVSVDRPTDASGGQTGNDTHVWLSDVNGFSLTGNDDVISAFPAHVIPTIGSRLMFTREDGSRTEGTVKSQHAFMPAVVVPGTSTVIPASRLNAFELYDDSHNYEAILPWFNCYSFGNGVESNRIRDDYNQVFIDKGAKVSTVLEEPYMEDRRTTGFIYSGIFNSTSNINNLNQFIQAEKITKDLNPDGGSIQKLFARDTDLITLCEDKIFKVLANKDALFNADGDPQLVATNRVLGTATTFSGDYGISTNPESFASESFRMYFADKSRGAVLRLSRDGLTPISSAGMTDWFNDNLPTSKRIIGSYDDKKKEYNITLSYVDYSSYNVGILCDVFPIFAMPGAPIAPPGYSPKAPGILVLYGDANKFSIGDVVSGAGIPIGSIITEKINKGGGEWWLKLSSTPDFAEVEALGLPIVYGQQAMGLPPTLATYQTRISASSPTSEAKTLTFSEQAKGWVSFKSFLQEGGISINNEYFTFYEGNLWQHHFEEEYSGYGNFYKQQFESSVHILFNEVPGSVKSFSTLNYEGSQSHITQDTTNSGEYWDNRRRLGWYVDNIYTDLQQGDRHEFKDKEGKWFSQIQGVTTEWLDDGKSGNLDSNEFSYQGIDESYGAVVIGGYTSWDCTPMLARMNESSNYNVARGTGTGTGTQNTVVGNGGCVEIPGLGGTYTTEADCYADVNTDCGDLCFQTETYADSNINVTFCNIAGATVQTNVYVTVDLDPTANSWTVVYKADNVPGVATGTEVADPNVYSYSGDSNPTLTLELGVWEYTVTDSNDCADGGSFSLECSIVVIPGCTDPLALNHDPLATIDDGSCVMPILGCTDPLGLNYNPLATVEDGSCIAPVYGCTDPLATNYYAGAGIDDGSCVYPILGCTDPLAMNYDPAATVDDGSCAYAACMLSSTDLWDYTFGAQVPADNYGCDNGIFTLDLTSVAANYINGGQPLPTNFTVEFWNQTDYQNGTGAAISASSYNVSSLPITLTEPNLVSGETYGWFIQDNNGCGTFVGMGPVMCNPPPIPPPRYNIFRLSQHHFGTNSMYVTLEVMKQPSGYNGVTSWDPIVGIQDLTPGYFAAHGNPIAGYNNTSTGTKTYRRWVKSFWPNGIASVIIKVNWLSGVSKTFNISCSTNGSSALSNSSISIPNSGLSLLPPAPDGCGSQLGYSNQQSGMARTLLNPSFPIGVISKAEVVSDPAGLLVTGEEAYHHISLAGSISNDPAKTSTPIWNLNGDWGNGFKPDSNSGQEQVIKIHSAVVEENSNLEYEAVNGLIYNNVQDIASAFGTGMYSPKVYSTSVSGTQAFNSINNFYTAHMVLEEDCFFFETVIYADELTPC